jgi:hypothetical protein
MDDMPDPDATADKPYLKPGFLAKERALWRRARVATLAMRRYGDNDDPVPSVRPIESIRAIRPVRGLGQL